LRVREVSPVHAMTRLRRPLALALITALLTGTAAPVMAADGDKMGFTTYYFTDSGENTVITTAFNLAKKVMRQTVLLLDIELDNVTVPPVTAVTGATRPQRRKGEPFEKSRGQVIVGVEQGFGATTTTALSGYRSQEVDYVSTSVIGTVSDEFFDRNLTLTARAQGNWDQVGEIQENGEVFNRPKNAFTGALTASQILSPTTVLDLQYDLVTLSGFLSDPYRKVAVVNDDGSRSVVDEKHPDRRVRHAASARVSQLIPGIEAALIGSYRYYFDSWEVRSSTIEMRLNKSILSNIILGVDYRWYSQSGASFYQDRYVGAQYTADALRTADYKLKPFDSNNFGFTLGYLFRGLAGGNPDLEFLQGASFEITYFRYFNTLDFSADIIQGGLKFSI
jgi:hypothetical protein